MPGVQARYGIVATAITDEIRQSLEAAAFDSSSESEENKHARISSSAAAFTLAQLAYLEDRPTDTAAMVGRVVDRTVLDPRGVDDLVPSNRLALMREWVHAHGETVPATSSRAYVSISPEATRRVASLSLGASLGLLVLAAVTLYLMIFASRRRNLIGELVDMRAILVE